jgi:hypothetical protein
LIAKSDNNKLIAMATKVELLTNQLNMAIERTNVLHKKAIKEGGLSNEETYVDGLKQQIEKLEKQLSESKAAEVFKAKKQEENNGQQIMPTADEVKISSNSVFNVFRSNTVVWSWLVLKHRRIDFASKWKNSIVLIR